MMKEIEWMNGIKDVWTLFSSRYSVNWTKKSEWKEQKQQEKQGNTNCVMMMETKRITLNATVRPVT